jgi:hypothetical protein
LRLGVDRQVAGKAHDLARSPQTDPVRVDLDDSLVCALSARNERGS